MNVLNGDGCSSNCIVETGYFCESSPSKCRKTALLCGNGLPDSGEGCDDGNSKSGDGCSNLCVVENGYICTQASTVRPSLCAPYNPNNNTNPSTGMRIDRVYFNFKNIFVKIVVDRVFTFADTN